MQSGSVNGSLSIFRVAKRLRSRNAWEPIYIGTNDEPLYDERLTWDGKRDKMSQVGVDHDHNHDTIAVVIIVIHGARVC